MTPTKEEIPEDGIPTDMQREVIEELVGESDDFKMVFGYSELCRAMDLYGEKIKAKLQADKPTGLRWVKASERMPPKYSGSYIVRHIKTGMYVTKIENWGHDKGWGTGDPTFEESEWLDESFPDETATLRAQLTTAQAERDAYRQDFEDAAGELLVDIPFPGTDLSKVMAANTVMRRQRDSYRTELTASRQTVSIERAHLNGIISSIEAERDRVAGEANQLREQITTLTTEVVHANEEAGDYRKALEEIKNRAEECWFFGDKSGLPPAIQYADETLLKYPPTQNTNS